MQHVLNDAPFMSAREKQRTLRAWMRFLRGGLCFADFTKRLHEHLHLHCGFIAHYNRADFYATYFERGEDTVRFLSSSMAAATAGLPSSPVGIGWRGLRGSQPGHCGGGGSVHSSPYGSRNRCPARG